MGLPSNLPELQPYLFSAAVIAFLLYRARRYRAIKRRLPELIKEGGVVVDVRSAGEFSAGSLPGSVNIPLGELSKRAGELNKEKPVILCCASGARSGAGAGILEKMGFKTVVNAGPWQNTLQN